MAMLQRRLTMNSEQLAWKIRRHGVEMTHLSGGSHLGSILSVADIMAVLYTDVLKVDPQNPDNENRDRFILSKGHAGAAVYAALAESPDDNAILNNIGLCYSKLANDEKAEEFFQTYRAPCRFRLF